MWKKEINAINLPMSFPYIKDINKISNGIKPSEIKPNPSKASPDSTENKMYNDIVNSIYASIIYAVNIKMSAAPAGSIKIRYASILNTVKYTQNNNLFVFQFSGESNITPGFATPVNVKLIVSHGKPIDAGSFTINTSMTDKQKIDATTYWFSKEPFTDISIPIDDNDALIKDYSDQLKSLLK